MMIKHILNEMRRRRHQFPGCVDDLWGDHSRSDVALINGLNLSSIQDRSQTL